MAAPTVRAAFPSIAAVLLSACLVASGCAGGRTPWPTAGGPLRLERVVLYRNGVGYFERRGQVEGDTLRLRVRKDHVNDLLKSLAVIDRSSGGRVSSVSLPLDPSAWHRAALEALRPGNGRLAQVLDSLRGTRISVRAGTQSATGRIVLVEPLGPPVVTQREFAPPLPDPVEPDHRLVLLDGDVLSVVRLSEVTSLSLEDGDVVMQIERHLDASAGEGMFQQVELSIRLAGEHEHDIAVTYIAPAPRWRPTYRLVLDETQARSALLQAWAVVDNTSGESWEDVTLSLTSGEPFAFQYDLYTPQDVERPDLSHSAADKHAQVAIGERTFSDADSAEPQTVADEENAGAEMAMEAAPMRTKRAMRRGDAPASAPAPAEPAAMGGAAFGAMAPAVSLEALEQSVAAKAQARSVAGLVRFDLADRVTLPDASASMVALLSERVEAEQAFLYRPGGSGQGYEHNPYRVARFENATRFALEPGPISVYAGGSFVGEGLSEAVGAGEVATIPFAVEPSIVVLSKAPQVGRGEVKKLRLVRGVLEVESFERVTTEWTVKATKREGAIRVLVRHPRHGGDYELVEPKSGVDRLPDAYLVPIELAADANEARVSVVEQTPRKYSVSLWDGDAVQWLDTWLASKDLGAEERARFTPIVKLRREMGRIDTEIQGLERQQAQLDERAREARRSLEAIEKDKGAGALRTRLARRMEELVEEAAVLGRRLVELQGKRLELKLELEDAIAASE